ncbi:hypothetical protein ANCCAN_04382 [Ancylostoma caninum]|uniref:7TM GPCR serpentine receptor class x (Srx) domain-containing protein n=1 Tax=Ancylostoma caninum TaxID=29170 RepID=A0A368H2V3_ANCCA|nr:hypothetical protein ANCCAN_04382 [Ancylostoma caninum]
MDCNSTTIDKDFTNFYVGLAIFVTGVIGGALNIHNVIAMCYIKDFCTSYGYLCRARAIFNIVNLSVFVLYTAPDTIL